VFVSCWSVKGGSGTTVVAVALSLLLAREHEVGTLLVDLAGDAPAVLGLNEPGGPGVGDWLAGGDAVPADGLARIEVGGPEGVSLLPCGPVFGEHAGRAEVLSALLADEPRAVVVDCGRVDTDETRRVVAAAATTSLLVTRPCYLALRRAVALPLRPSGIVLLAEPWRALDAGDVEEVLGVPVVAEVAHDAAVARAVDAGVLASRVPRDLARALRFAA
jgi:MinD-like ATPase involved in chromosome partitioning or flagellar assembly